MKKVLLYFVMLLCLVFVFLPPILRLTYKDPVEESAIKESGVLVCNKANPSELLRIVYSSNNINMILYEYNDYTFAIKDLKEYFDQNRFTTRDYQENENVQAYIQYAAHPDEILKLPPNFQKNYIETEKEVKKYGFVCTYQKM